MAQDVAINNTPVVLALFGTGINAPNDVTHLGWFDIALISNTPGWVYLAPTCKEEYQAMLRWAVKQTEHPVAIRQPGSPVWVTDRKFPEDYSELNKPRVVYHGKQVAIIAAGSTMRQASEAIDALSEKEMKVTMINPVYLSGLDTELLESLKGDHKYVITLEDGVLDGGYGEKVALYYGDSDMKVICRGIPKEFLDRYDQATLAEQCRLTKDVIVSDVEKLMRG